MFIEHFSFLFKFTNFFLNFLGFRVENITIPSGIFTDLENGNFIGNILYSYNERDLRNYSYMNWIYSKTFNIAADDLNHEFVMLTFHGLDTITKIMLNDQLLGQTDNMFRRFKFDVKNFLVEVSLETVVLKLFVKALYVS